MAARVSEWMWVGSVVSVIVLLLMITHLLSSGTKSRTTKETEPIIIPKLKESSPTPTNHSMTVSQNKIRIKRQSADALIDPYSILGLLSFGTFILSVLYNRYKMKNPSPSKNSASSGMPGGTTKLGSLSQETIEQIMKAANKFIKDTQSKPNKNSTSSSDDYYDTDFDKRTHPAGSARAN